MDFENKEIRMLLEQRKSERRKSINVNIEENLINEIDDIVEKIGKVSSTFCSRNTFIEVASRNYLKHLKSIVDELNIDTNNPTQSNNQVIIFTCSEKAGTYNEMFLNNYWNCVPLGKEVVNLINKGIVKYFALYRGVPYQHIDSYAEILSVRQLPNRKYEFKLGDIKELPKPILIGNTVATSLMKGKRTTLSKLLSASTIDQL